MSTITEVHQPAAIGMRGHAKQLSSTDSKIKNIAKTAFQKIAAFFAYCQSNCKSAYATLKAKCLALKARITSFFKKSDSLSQPSQKFESFSGERDQSNSVVSRSRSPSPADGLQGRPGTPVRSRSPSPADGQPASPRTPVRSRSPSPVNNQQAQVNAPELTPETGALIPHQPNPSLQALHQQSSNGLVANNCQIPSATEARLYLLQNSSRLESPVEMAPPVNAEQVLAPAIRFAQELNRPNTSPDANVDQPSGSKVSALVLVGGTAAIAAGLVLRKDPEALNNLVSRFVIKKG